jgi:hypothetical protein
MTPPSFLLLDAFGGNWRAYESELHRIFMDEIVRGGLQFRGQRVNCRRNPETGGRWSSFWHLVQEGRVERERMHGLRRCARLLWVRWVIEKAAAHHEIKEWQSKRRGETDTLPWYREEYLVVLAQSRGNWLLRTAFCTDQPHRVPLLRQERAGFQCAAGR